jgi:ribosomal protein S6
MAQNLYECLFLLDPTKIGTDLEAIRAQLHGVIDKFKGEILASRPWGNEKTKLAYPIRNTKKLNYYLLAFRAESKNLNAIEYEYKLNEGIARLLIVKIDPKWEEKMLEVARDESALGYQAFVDDSLDVLGEEAAASGGRRSRRQEVEYKD